MKQFMTTIGKTIVAIAKVIGTIFYNDAYIHQHERPYSPRIRD